MKIKYIWFTIIEYRLETFNYSICYDQTYNMGCSKEWPDKVKIDGINIPVVPWVRQHYLDEFRSYTNFQTYIKNALIYNPDNTREYSEWTPYINNRCISNKR